MLGGVWSVVRTAAHAGELSTLGNDLVEERHKTEQEWQTAVGRFLLSFGKVEEN